ncbi:MAG: zinc dependent phospholipase C family protein [Candidatus Acidiferrales bacterium]
MPPPTRRNAYLLKALALTLALGLTFGWPRGSAAYSVLAHEAIVDSAWTTNIRPLILKRFPNATPEQLREAHGYAYGGAIIQDMGYYPHGSHFFSDLAHYVRSGDFIVALIRDSKDINGYAFALGALSHYAGDTVGHSLGVNPSVPILYPKLRKKYGPWVTYEQDPLAHIKTEFGFDVLEVAQHRYAPQSYHNFIGFGVSVPLLEQAFQETYGLDLKSVLTNEDEVLGSYRHDVSQLIPKATRVAWSLKKNDIRRDQPSMTKKKFLYNLSRSSYRKYWGKNYKSPSVGERFLAFLVRILPKIGPLKILELRTPTPATERLFEASFNASLSRYRQLLGEVEAGRLSLPNVNFDTGQLAGPGKYWLDDQTQAELLDALAKEHFHGASPALRAELLNYFGDPNAHYATEKRRKTWTKVQAELRELRKSAPPNPTRAILLPSTNPAPSARGIFEQTADAQRNTSLLAARSVSVIPEVIRQRRN